MRLADGPCTPVSLLRSQRISAGACSGTRRPASRRRARGPARAAVASACRTFRPRVARTRGSLRHAAGAHYLPRSRVPRLEVRAEVLVVEQAQLGVDERDAVLAAGRLDLVVARRAAGLRDEPDAVALCVLDVVAERDEPVRDERDAGHARDPRAPLVVRERLERDDERRAEVPLLARREIALDVADAPVDALLLLHALLEAETQHLRVRAQPPEVG